MHIPVCQSQSISLLSFEEALARSGSNSTYDSSHWLYVPDFYAEYRYILGTRGQNPLICIGINPSTAAPDALDNTLKSVSRIAAGNGYDSWIMFNVYAQRATDPNHMDREWNIALHKENMNAFTYILHSVQENGYSPAIWAAWGTIVEKRSYLPQCLRDMVTLGERYDARWLCAGKCSAKGHPHHPLYLRKDESLRDFDVRRYLDTR